MVKQVYNNDNIEYLSTYLLSTHEKWFNNEYDKILNIDNNTLCKQLKNQFNFDDKITQCIVMAIYLDFYQNIIF